MKGLIKIRTDLYHDGEGYPIKRWDRESWEGNIAPDDYNRGWVESWEVMDTVIPPREYIFSGLIAYKTLTMIYGDRGSGKTWLTYALANAAAWGEQIGPWSVPIPIDVGYIDGEMEYGDIQRRLMALNRGRRRSDQPKNLWIYSESDCHYIGLNRASVLNPRWSERIKEEVVKSGIKLLIIDNIASLAPGIDENSTKEYSPVNIWLKELRSLGMAVILVHHSGKAGSQRGTSSREDHLDLILEVKSTIKDSSFCAFSIKVTKDRSCDTESRKWTMRLTENDDGRAIFEYEEFVSEGHTTLVPAQGKPLSRTSTQKIASVIKFIERHPKASNTVIAQACGISRNRVSKYKALIEECNKCNQE